MRENPAVLALLVLVSAVPCGCRRAPRPAAAGETSSAARATGARPTNRPPAALVVEGPAPSLEPLALGPLREETADQVVAKLVRAHYDPQSLGLVELAFALEFAQTKTGAGATGEGRWKKGETPDVELHSVSRGGKIETAPADKDLQAQISTSLKYQLQNLLAGLGRGFLSQRLEGWEKLQGKARLVEGGAEQLLSFSEKFGDTEVTVGRDYVVERVVNRSPKKVTRSVYYTYRTEAGRHLVTRAVFRVVVEPDAKIPPQATAGLKGSDGMLSEITYDRVGGFLLPIRLRKLTPATGDDLTVTLRYTKLRTQR
jgi:hypothetical protein